MEQFYSAIAGVYRTKDIFPHRRRAADFFGGVVTHMITELSSCDERKFFLLVVIFLCALRWFRTNQWKLSEQGKESALEFCSEEDAKIKRDAPRFGTLGHRETETN
ncbi:hypothetical protein TNCV_3265101 [Trichonephila clavipes]|nr:hypothetical protein TNCV_3265101 [Trichonephila clavipes]